MKINGAVDEKSFTSNTKFVISRAGQQPNGYEYSIGHSQRDSVGSLPLIKLHWPQSDFVFKSLVLYL